MLCFVFVSDSSNKKSGLKRSYCENTFRICFKLCKKRIRAFNRSLGDPLDCRKQGEISDKYVCMC